MIRYRLRHTLFALACSMLAAVPTLAAPANGHLPAWFGQHFSAPSPRIQAARQQALASSSGNNASVAAPALAGGLNWTPRHTLYVGCTNTPPSSTFSGPTGIQDALNVAVPYTTIKVCRGTYEGNNFVGTPHVAIVGQGPTGAVAIQCQQGGSLVNNSPFFDAGIATGASYDRISNVTVVGCYFGVFLNGGILGALYGNTLPPPITANEVSDVLALGNYVGVVSVVCDGCEVEGSEFAQNQTAIVNAEDVEDRIVGNEITGDGTGNEEGITIVSSIRTVVKGNTVEGTDNALYNYLGPAEFSSVEGNHFNHNVTGVYLQKDANGNVFRENTASYNSHDGFFADATTGAAAPGNQLPNRFLYNKAFNNGNLDYEDLTAGYSGPVSGTNDGTANYYHGNKGNTSAPPSITH